MKKWIVVVLVLLLLYMIGMIFAFTVFDNGKSLGNKIAVVPINGIITTVANDGGYFGDSGASSTQIVADLKDLASDDSVKGVILEIDSPGGAVVASQEIADAVNSLNKTTYAVIREVGASGAYWVASASDKIYASPMSVTGSIGVIASYLEFSQLFDKYGVGYERLVGGQYKDVGTPYRELTDEERDLLQEKIDLIHEFFIQEVATNRNVSVSDIRSIATGEFFLGMEAKEFGLVDELGNKEKAIGDMKIALNLTDISIVEKIPKKDLLDILLSSVAYDFGRGFAATLVSFNAKNKGYIRA